MMNLDIPGFGRLKLATLVADYNGTLARDGLLLDRAREGLMLISQHLRVHVVTGDTFGTVHEELRDIPCEIAVMPTKRQAEAKIEYATHLGIQNVVAFGNGRNDRLLLSAAAVGVAVLGDEGAATEAVQASDLVVHDVADAFALFLEPRRLIATMRS